MCKNLSKAMETKVGEWLCSWTESMLTAVDGCISEISDSIKVAEVVNALTVIRSDELQKDAAVAATSEDAVVTLHEVQFVVPSL